MILATVLGVSGATVTSVILAYDKIFPRYERPDYELRPGQYCIERVPNMERTEIWIPSDENRLKGYVYEAKDSKGLVVFAHGFRAGADDYLPIFKYLTDHNYSVLAYNVTGTYESEGNSMVGMCQSLVDMNRVIGYVQKNEKFRDMPLFTMGHSWGGYAATSVLAIKKDIRACAVIAPMRNGASMMVDKAEQYVGSVATMTSPAINGYQKILFGDYVDFDAIRGINESGIPVLVAQGIDDTNITFNGLAVTAARREITNPNVVYYFGRGLQGGHDSIWHSVEAVAYQEQVKSDLKLLEMQKGEALTEAEIKAYYKTADHALYSAVNEDLMEQVVQMFDDALK